MYTRYKVLDFNLEVKGDCRNLVSELVPELTKKIQLTTQTAVGASLLLFVFWGQKSVGPIITHSSVFSSPIIQYFFDFEVIISMYVLRADYLGGFFDKNG